MNEQRYLLLIEDSRHQYLGVKADFAKSNWHIRRAEDEAATFYAIDQAESEGTPIEAVALDLGLPPEKENPLRSGLLVAERLRRYDDELPILAYTGMSPKTVDYGLLLAKLLPLRISFVALRGGSGNETSLLDLLELVWQGFVLQSPVTAAYLPQAIPSKPDPLNADQWETLKLLSHDLTQNQIAERLNVTAEGIKSRLNKISDQLTDSHQLKLEGDRREQLINWYRHHYARYCRY